MNDTSILKDQYLSEHHENVRFYSTVLASKLNVPNELYEVINRAAKLHDIGKIGIPNSILFKPGKLTPEEWKIMKLHPITGADLLLNSSRLVNSPCFKEVIKTVLYHHERWDGQGYPDGLKGEEIPLTARIVAIADSFDAMISSRPYKKPIKTDEAINEIIRCAGTQFDPEIVAVFVRSVNQT